MNTIKGAPNKRYVFIAVGLFVILIPISIIIISTLLGGNPTNQNQNNEAANITTNNNGQALQAVPSISSILQLPLSFQGLLPGKATQSLVTNTLGTPQKTSHAADYTIYYFATKGTDKYNMVIFKNNIVQYIIEQKPTLPSLFTQYKKQVNKNEDGVLYDANDDNSGVNLYVFAQRGIAFADNPDTDQTSQVHYFIPEAYQTFLLSEGIYINFQNSPTN